MGHFARRDSDPTAYPQVTRLAHRGHGYAVVADGHATPAELLDRLDREMRYFESDAMATVLCAMVSRPRCG
jgi:hypothetical protein